MNNDKSSDIQAALLAVKGKEFWRQGSEAKFAYCLMPLPACTSMKRLYGVSFRTTVGSVKEGFCTWFHCLEGFRELSDFYLARLKNEDVIPAVEEEWKHPREELLAYCDDIFDADLEGESLLSLAVMLKKIGELDEKNWERTVFIDSFDPRGEEIIEEAIEKHAPSLKEHMTLLMTTEEPSYVQQEHISLAKIAHAAERGEDVTGQLKEHQKKFFWYNNSFAHPVVLDVEHFRARLEDATGIEETIREKQRQIEKRDELLERAPEELRKLLRFFQWMTDLRDRRKKVNCIKMSAMRLLFEALSGKTSIQVELLENMFYKEADLLLAEREEYADELKRRQEHALIISIDDHKPIVLSDRDADEVRDAIGQEAEEADEIRGKCACKGNVKGRVRIIRKVTDFEKFNDGDILVAAMTRPEHMPVIRKAAAIVTDEGGVTCHASIVSRELGKPCVIGTQHATDVLRDGQLVEVDATNGLIRIVERGR